MGHVFHITDEQYTSLTQSAAARGVTAEQLFAEWIEAVTSQPSYYETEDWFRHLGATEEQIAEAKRIARSRSEGKSANP